MKESIYCCPHCHAKSFNPWTKAFVGGMNTRGTPCKACGKRCVNGKESTIFSAVVYVAALVFVFVVYLGMASLFWDLVLILGTIAAAFVICRLFDAFFGRLVPVLRNDAYSS